MKNHSLLLLRGAIVLLIGAVLMLTVAYSEKSREYVKVQQYYMNAGSTIEKQAAMLSEYREENADLKAALEACQQRVPTRAVSLQIGSMKPVEVIPGVAMTGRVIRRTFEAQEPEQQVVKEAR